MLVNIIGLLAGALVLASFHATEPRCQRRRAIASNALFLIYGTALSLWPVVILHGLLLPLNILRLAELSAPKMRTAAGPVSLASIGWFALSH